jgi:hypothetical protein
MHNLTQVYNFHKTENIELDDVSGMSHAHKTNRFSELSILPFTEKVFIHKYFFAHLYDF